MPEDQLIYLDYNATTPLDPRVLAAMQASLRDDFGNAASRQHRAGQRAADAVAKARLQVAAVIGADEREIYWTSGATESNNVILKGVAASAAYAKRKHVVTVRTEHRAVLDPCRYLEEQGYQVTFLGVDGEGRLDFEQLANALRDDTLLVSVMHGNNETGVLQPIAEIGAICRERAVLFHTDAAQSFGKEVIDVDSMCIDMLSFSGHKVYGPKGVGGMYLRRRGPRVRCEPLLHGGGHERGLRSGTLNVPGIVGMGAGAAISMQERDMEQERVRSLRDQLQAGLLQGIKGALVNAGDAPRLAGTLNVSFPGVDADELLESLPDLALSTASACTSAELQPSYVLGAMGLEGERLKGSVRVSLGRFTSEGEVEKAREMLVAGVEKLRELGSA